MEWSIFAQVCHLLLTTAQHFGLAVSLPCSGSVGGGLSFQPSLEGTTLQDCSPSSTRCSLQTGSVRSGSRRSPDCKGESSKGGRQESTWLSWAAWHLPWERRTALLGECASLPVPLGRGASPSQVTSRTKAGAVEPRCTNSIKKEKKDSSE